MLEKLLLKLDFEVPAETKTLTAAEQVNEIPYQPETYLLLYIIKLDN
jgi:hypothetical protein